MSRKGSVIITLLSLLSMTGCNYPVRDYSTVRLDRMGHDPGDTLEFVVDIVDSLSTYDISFGARVDKSFIYPTINAELLATTPDSILKRYEISIPADIILHKRGKTKVSSQNGVYDIEWKWKEGVKVSSYGEWKIQMLLKGGGEKIKGIHEIGINCEPNERKR